MAFKGTKEDPTDIDYLMKESDASSFAELMDLKTAKADRGYALATLKLSDQKHLNFRGMTHGAVIFAVADHACGTCGNSLGRKAVLVHSNIIFLANPEPGSILEAEARMTHEDDRSGTMVIDVKTGSGRLLARSQCIVHFLR